jgi:hypothetical protein
MVFGEVFNEGLLKAEQDTSGEDSILRIDVDPAVRRAKLEEYEQEARISRHFHPPLMQKHSTHWKEKKKKL